MTAESGANGQKLDDVVRDSDGYYKYLRKKEANGTRLDVAVVSVIVWFASFVVLAVTSLALTGCLSPATFFRCVSPSSTVMIPYLIYSALAGLGIAAASGVATYVVRRSRRVIFEEVQAQLNKLKEGEASSEDGLRLMDALHRAALAVKKRSIDSAFEYGVGAFVVFTILGANAVVGLLAGALAYFYFREKALREYEKEDARYENSKKDLLQSL